jgi:hypothetical protein
MRWQVAGGMRQFHKLETHANCKDGEDFVVSHGAGRSGSAPWGRVIRTRPVSHLL